MGKIRECKISSRYTSFSRTDIAGTEVTFLPDESVFENIKFRYDTLKTD